MRTDTSAPRRVAPDAVHVGFSKCASTFLQRFFSDHPRIFLVEKAHFFAPFEFCAYDETATAYRSLFAGAADEQICVDSDEHTVLPLLHPVLEVLATTLDAVREVSARIRKVAPTARIIIVVRRQNDLLLSRYAEYVLGGGTWAFEPFVGELLECSTDGENYFQNFYSQILETFRADFPPDNVLMLLQEDLRGNETETIARLAAFLDIEARAPVRDLRSRRISLSKRGIAAMRRFNRIIVTRHARADLPAEVRLPRPLYNLARNGLRVTDYYLPASIKGSKRALLTDSLAARIGAVFADDNARLGRMLDRDLSVLGY